VFRRYFSLQRKKGENEYIIAAKVTFFAVFRLQAKFTLVSTLFLMVMQHYDTRFHPPSKKG